MRYSAFEVRPIAGAVGTEVPGVDIAESPNGASSRHPVKGACAGAALG